MKTTLLNWTVDNSSTRNNHESTSPDDGLFKTHWAAIWHMAGSDGLQRRSGADVARYRPD